MSTSWRIGETFVKSLSVISSLALRESWHGSLDDAEEQLYAKARETGRRRSSLAQCSGFVDFVRGMKNDYDR